MFCTKHDLTWDSNSNIQSHWSMLVIRTQVTSNPKYHTQVTSDPSCFVPNLLRTQVISNPSHFIPPPWLSVCQSFPAWFVRSLFSFMWTPIPIIFWLILKKTMNMYRKIRWNLKFPHPLLKPLDTFGTEKKLKVHRFTNNLQGLQKVMVKDFSWNVIPFP